MMPEMDMMFVVAKRKKEENEGKTVYSVRLTHGAGHYLVLKGESETIFEGLPIGQPVGVKLGNPQTTLKSPKP